MTQAEPRVMLQVTGKSINFLMDMGATYLVLPSFGDTLHPSQVLVVGIDGTSSRPLQTGPQPCQLDHFLFTHFSDNPFMPPSPAGAGHFS